MTKLLWSVPVAAALATVSTASFAQTPPVPEPTAPAAPPPPAPAPTEVRLDLVNGEVKLLALDETKSWTVEPQGGGLLARAVDDGHTLRLVAQKDGIYTVRLEHNDGTIAVYAVHVGKDSPTVAGPPAPPPADGSKPPGDRRTADDHYYANTIDLNLEGGAGRHFGDDGKTIGFGRARAGLMFARWPVFTMIGATYEYSNLAPAAFGIQGELLHLSAGFWGQLGAEIDTHAKAGVMAALGFSVIGVEAQYRGYQADDGGLVTGFAVLGKIRVPLGVILYAVDKSRNHH